MPTIFSFLISWEIPSFKIYEDDYVFAFLDIRPHTPGHTLIVPKIEVDHFFEVPEPYYSAIFQAAKMIAPALRKAMNVPRVGSLIMGFEIPHFHLHLIPMSDPKHLDPNSAKPADFWELKIIQESIIKCLQEC